MLRCPHCKEYVDGHPEMCPVCSRSLSASIEAEEIHSELENSGFEGHVFEGPLVSIARFHNAAEAGYFAHELTVTEEIPAVVRVEEHFDAMSGYWANRFLLLVPEPLAETAASVLQNLVENSDCDELAEGETLPDAWSTPGAMNSGEEGELFGTEPATPSGVNWVPIVLTLAAGSAAFWGVRNFQERPQPQAGAVPIGVGQQDFWSRLSSSPEPWIQRRDGGRGTRSILIETNGDLAIIREDGDGDGVYEKEHRVRREAVLR